MAACTTTTNDDDDDDDDRSMTGILCIGARTETVSYVTTTAAHLDVAVNRKFNSGCVTQNLDYEAAAQK